MTSKRRRTRARRDRVEVALIYGCVVVLIIALLLLAAAKYYDKL